MKVIVIPGASSPELEKWRDKFESGDVCDEEIQERGIEIKTFDDLSEKDKILTLIKVGGNEYKPTVLELEVWRELLEDAQKYPDFKIFTHCDVSIERINMKNNDTTIIVGDYKIIDKDV